MNTSTTLPCSALARRRSRPRASGCGEEPLRPRPSPGNICTIAGSGENGYDRNADTTALPALEARFSLPQDTLTAPDGTLYILDWNNHRLRKLDAPTAWCEWVAGRGELGGSLDDPANGDFNHPTNIIFDATGDEHHHRRVAQQQGPASSTSTRARSRTAAATARRAYFGDEGPALTASLDLPASIALDPRATS